MISETKDDGNLVDFDARKRVGPIIVHLATFERDDMLFRFGRIAATTDPEVLQLLQRSLDGNGRFIFETEDGKLWSALLMGGTGGEYYDFSAVTPHAELNLN